MLINIGEIKENLDKILLFGGRLDAWMEWHANRHGLDTTVPKDWDDPFVMTEGIKWASNDVRKELGNAVTHWRNFWVVNNQPNEDNLDYQDVTLEAISNPEERFIMQLGKEEASRLVRGKPYRLYLIPYE